MIEMLNSLSANTVSVPQMPEIGEQAGDIGYGILPLVVEYPVNDVTNGGGNAPVNDNGGKPFDAGSY
jgi:hypothetical protein